MIFGAFHATGERSEELFVIEAPEHIFFSKEQLKGLRAVFVLMQAICDAENSDPEELKATIAHLDSKPPGTIFRAFAVFGKGLIQQARSLLVTFAGDGHVNETVQKADEEAGELFGVQGHFIATTDMLKKAFKDEKSEQVFKVSIDIWH
jgi:hypothetical protein